MKSPVTVILLLLFSFTCTLAQDLNTRSFFYLKKKYVESPYLDVGGMFLPAASSTINFNLGFGYQFNTLAGVGLSYSVASSYGGFDDKFNGFGFDYRIQMTNWWFKNTIGIVNNYFPSQKSVIFEYADGEENQFFYRASAGWIPKGGIFKIGLTYHLTDKAIFNSICETVTPCNTFSDERNVGNIQLFIGIHLPNPNRKNLEKTILRK